MKWELFCQNNPNIRAIADKYRDSQVEKGFPISLWCTKKQQDTMKEQFGLYKKGGQCFDSDSCSFVLGIPHGLSIIFFSLSVVPNCCAMCLFHDFSTYQGPLSKEEIKQILDICLEWWGVHEKSNRVIINMVETGRYSHDQFEIFKLEEAELRYNEFAEYFRENCGEVRTTIMPNKNTGNLIHHMECLFEDGYFEEDLEEDEDDF